MTDPYTYPGTDVLINLEDIREPHILARYEARACANRMLQLQSERQTTKLSLEGLCDIHRAIFQDIYPWAGKTRTVNISKHEMFCPVQNIKPFAHDVFANLSRAIAKHGNAETSGPHHEMFCGALADAYGDLNALHPFREGNGRAQREMLRQICESLGYVLDLRQVSGDEMRQASRLAFYAQTEPLSQIFVKTIVPKEVYEAQKKTRRHNHPFVTLTEDDVPKWMIDDGIFTDEDEPYEPNGATIEL